MYSQMKSFMAFLAENLSEAVVDLEAGIFVKVLPTTESTVTLKSELSLLRPIVDDLHCTVIYSKTAGKGIKLPFVMKDRRFKADGVKLEYWEGHDKEGYVVLKLKSEALQSLHSRFRKQGIEPTFKEYNPHVTIQHPVPKPDEVTPIIDMMNLFLASNPISLEFYYGGYTIMEKEDGN